jgi:hypothetical protein
MTVEVYYHHIPHAPGNPFPLGRHLARDPRNGRYPFDLRARGLVGKPVHNMRHHVYGGRRGILDQKIGDCTCCMLTYSTRTGHNYTQFKKLQGHRVILMDDDAEQAYEWATAHDPFPGYYKPGDPKSQDTGSDGTSACNAGIEKGWITRFEHADATLDNAIQILQHYAIGIGVNWYRHMFNPTSRGFVEPGPGERPVGGHEILLNEVNVDEQWFGFPQSWGSKWGLGGYGKMSFSTVRRLFLEDGDLVVPIV